VYLLNILDLSSDCFKKMLRPIRIIILVYCWVIFPGDLRKVINIRIDLGYFGIEIGTHCFYNRIQDLHIPFYAVKTFSLTSIVKSFRDLTFC